ncbi:hypothetical protein Poly59_36990 [Rubripirellula reticaptiva]|uniref:Transposase n=1 Tax=Rubripirellula reticaptiva TaxID=2528013 RepID=A0A5C6ENC3_9BACT|nr:hypothetical protein Poly59_36990 [Rubripirellula reticaptiva]
MDKRGTFSREFKLAAVKKVIEQGLWYAAVAKDLNMRETMLRNRRSPSMVKGPFRTPRLAASRSRPS